MLKFWQTLYGIDRRWLYLVLMALVFWQMLSPVKVPNVRHPMSADLYNFLSGLDEGDFVLVQSDWTMSTAGESKGQFEALMRLLMRKKLRFVVTSVANPASPTVAREVIATVAKEPGNNNYRENQNYAIAGYFPNGENHVMGMVNNIRRELRPRGVNETPAMLGINDLSDAKAVILITGSATILQWYERMRNKTNLGLMCTAVMAGENIPYYSSRQLVGLAIGAKGAYDFEDMLAEEFKATGLINFASGLRYMSPLAFALGLLVLAVVAGNVAMIVLRRGENNQ